MQGDKLQSLTSDSNFNPAFLVRCVPNEDAATVQLELDKRSFSFPKSVVNIMTKTFEAAKQEGLVGNGLADAPLPTSVSVALPFLAPKQSSKLKCDPHSGEG